MSINTCYHNFLEIKMIRVEMSPIETSLYSNEYSYPITGDFINFFYPYSQEKLEYFFKFIEGVIEINLNDFVKRVEVSSKNNVEVMFIHRDIEKNKSEVQFFGHNSELHLDSGNQPIAFKFTHFETALLHLKSVNKNTNEYLPDEKIKLIKKDNYLIFNKSKVVFVENNENGEREVFNAKINNIEFVNGAVNKITSYGYWALTNNVNIEIEFNQNPLDVFDRSSDNAIITINFDKNTKWQWSLINGEYLGKIDITLN